MEKTTILVDTAKLLRVCQNAYIAAVKVNDTATMKSAESVMSALIVVLKYKTARLPEELRVHIERIGGFQ